MSTFIEPSDLAPFATIDMAKALEMIADAEAQAILVAPCIATLTTAPDGETADALALRTAKIAGVKSILRAAILRWNDGGSGTIQTQTTGPFSQTTQVQARRAMFYASEKDDLRDLCKDADASKSYAVDTVPSVVVHAVWCDLMLGGTTCSCGADIAGYPIYGTL